MGIELGFEIGATVKKVILRNGDEQEETVGAGVGAKLAGKAETGLELTAKALANNNNEIGIQGAVHFLGVTLEVVGVFGVSKGDDDKSKEKSPQLKVKKNIVGRKNNILQGEFILND